MSDTTRALFYTVDYKGQPVIGESLLDIKLDNHLSEQAMALKVDGHKDWCENLKITHIDYVAKDSSWQPVYGEQKISGIIITKLLFI